MSEEASAAVDEDHINNSTRRGDSLFHRATSREAGILFDEPGEILDTNTDANGMKADDPAQVDVITKVERAPLTACLNFFVQEGVPCRLLLIIDSTEIVRERVREHELDTMTNRLLDQGVECEVRQLPCGDAMFVAKYSHDVEVVLDYIIERKTLEDFIRSMHDGRVRRQSFTMRQSQIPHLLFLLEGNIHAHPDLKEDAQFHSRKAEMEMCENMYVKETRDLNDTICFYSSMYKRLKAEFEGQPLAQAMNGRSLFADWKERMIELTRGITLKELFMLQLCQVRGVGKQSAMGIVDNGCETPSALFEKFRSVQGSEERVRVLVQEMGISSRVARTLIDLFTATSYGTVRI